MSRAVRTSQRVYRTLLRAYPPDFRREYGDEMALTFRDAVSAAERQKGAAGVLSQWAQTIPDFIVSVIDEHAQENLQMARTNFVRLLAAAGIAGGALWTTFAVILTLQASGVPGSAYRQGYDPGELIIYGMALAAAGLIGVALKPGRTWPAGPRGLLLLAVAGGLEPVLAWFFAYILLGIDLSTQSYVWMIFVAGYLMMFVGLGFGGLLLLIVAPAQRLWAMLFMGWGLTMLLFNTEDLRALFGVMTGIVAIVTFALMLTSALNRQDKPPVVAG